MDVALINGRPCCIIQHRCYDGISRYFAIDQATGVSIHINSIIGYDTKELAIEHGARCINMYGPNLQAEIERRIGNPHYHLISAIPIAEPKRSRCGVARIILLKKLKAL